ncbi:iron chaperone [Levilactobacillus tangyuanensis]|uniref:Iron chaperone n=1 Tax=Levilactobacillus tangyuanensis TaxID=2486021 RepID=A0ABW1TSY5_9LACO|nr:DUF1801 domain-containing protein [Levilactobacillus tangyuanensis]
MSPIPGYIAQAPAEHQAQLTAMYHLLQAALPDATERMSYGMPAFYQGKPVAYFGAAKHHLGFYPTSSPIVQFKAELAPYPTSKGAVQFAYDQPLPEKLINAMVQFRLKEIQNNQ